MSFNRSYKSPNSDGSTSSTPSFLLPKTASPQATVSLNSDNLTAEVINHKNSPESLINYLEQLDVTGNSSKKSKSRTGSSSNAPPTLNSILNIDGNNTKKGRELISAMTYEEGTALDESSDDDETDNKQNELEEKKMAIAIQKEDSAIADIDHIDESESNDKETSFLESVVDENQKDELTKDDLSDADKPVDTLKDVQETTEETTSKSDEPPQATEDTDESVQQIGTDSVSVSGPSDGTSPANEGRPSLSKSRKGSDFPITALDTKQQQFDFQRFLRQFKNKQCEPVHKYLKSFIIQFSQKNWNVKDQVKLIKDFEVFIFGKLITYPPFDKMDSESELSYCKEGLEKLIISRLYNQIFPPVIPERKLTDSHREDLKADKIFYKNLRMHEWLELKHLDIPMALKINSTFIKLASIELVKINSYKSPRDKIICILNCCKVIFGLIRQQQKSHEIEENADSFVPLLIYVILQSKPKHLPSNLSFIERYRNEDFLIGEVSYYVSTLQIATNFISTIDKTLLTISEEEYNEKIQDAKVKLEAELEEKRAERQRLLAEKRQANSPIPKKITELINNNIVGMGSSSNPAELPSQVLKNSAEMLQQSFTNFFGNINQSSSDDQQQQQQQQQQPQSRRQEQSDKDLLEVTKLSIEDHEREVTKRKEREEMVVALIQMFPTLDQDLINDVVMNSESGNIGDYVDSCLELCS